MEDLLLQQKNNADVIRKFNTNTNKVGKANQTKGFFQSRIGLLDKYWKKFENTHDLIILVPNDSAADSYHQKGTYDEIETIYTNTLGSMNDSMLNFNIVRQPVENEGDRALDQEQGNGIQNIRLPAIALPKFSGDFSKWTSFHDLFDSLVVKNAALSNVNKLHHLKSSLLGEAELVLRQFAVEENNFVPAWALLRRRYANKRMMANAQFSKLITQPRLSNSKPEAIRHLLDTATESITALKSQLTEAERFDALAVYILTQKLDIKTTEAWEQSINNQDEFQTFTAFSTFLENHCRTQELVRSTTIKPVDNYVQDNHRTTKSYYTSTPKTNCTMCQKDNHAVFKCFKFKKLSAHERINFAKYKRLCMRCLSADHKFEDCPHSYECFKCKEPHNFLLHTSQNKSSSSNAISSNQPQRGKNNFDRPKTSDDSTIYTHYGTNLSHRSQPQTLLATAQVIIISPGGQAFRMRALIDPGSQASLITRSAANILNLKFIKCNTTVRGLGATTAGESSELVNCTVRSIHNQTQGVSLEAIVMPRLTDKLPSNRVAVSASWTHLHNLPLADPLYYKPEKIDLILGADTYGEIIISEIRKGPIGTPVAQNSIFGWILIGKAFIEQTQETRSREIMTYYSEAEVCTSLRRFWELEDVSDLRKPTKNDELCEEHFQKNHIRRHNGSYSVDLPFNTNDNIPPIFGNTRNQALMRFFQMERRLQSNPVLKTQYSNFMSEYLQLGHMSISTQPITSASFFLPHHAIVKPSSISTKVRVVFDASAKDSKGTSLNDTLHIGPTIQQDLLSILLRWRKHKIAITADVEKMYRQIGINDHHQPFQRILWRNDDGDIKDYKLSTVTYGTACAPYLAIRTLHQLASDEQSNFPHACDRTIKDMYVDDFISGSDTIQEAHALQSDMVNLFRRGGFNLRKWSSNATQVLDDIPSTQREGANCLDVCRDDMIKTLGIMWHTFDDKFHFIVKPSVKPSKFTKRTLLSDVAKLFDPIGLLAPVVINAKILFQSLWLKGLSWDEQLPEDIVTEWLNLRSKLCEVTDIKIPRWIGTSRINQKTEFHGFCDASNKAYAAVVYCRTVNNGIFKVSLLTSKTRVAPIKKISLPNLELCGATLLATLIKKVQESMEINAEIFAWTDSTIVLDWMQSNTHKQIFVANRVSTILGILEPSQWRHVRSKENPADVASRGICPTQLKSHSLWWQGPSWLQQTQDEWPKFYTNENKFTTIVEVHTNTITRADEYLTDVIKKYSSFNKVLRVIARCIKFSRKCLFKSKGKIIESSLTSNNIQEAKTKLIQYIQSQSYPNELATLRKGEQLTSSKILSLYPFICNNNLLRVGGRLRNAEISYDHKHPILLPREHHFTKLIIENIHVNTLHGGLKIMLGTLRQNYWVSNARNSIRSIIHKCVMCHRYSTTGKQQLMSALPSARVQQSKVFAHTGMDYAGPFDLRLSKHRGRGTYKGFVSIFICLATKAIHLELASDLSTTTFIGAFKRFVGRRGMCSDIYSDNGTNFVGANRTLQSKFDETIHQLQKSAAEMVAIKGVQWHFIPACSPHFGGLWEAGVKSFKHHLKRILDNTTLTYEEFLTLLIEIEAVLNSRPLCPLSSDPNDTDALTPGHFLTGGPLNAVPEPSLLNMRENRLNRWQYIEKLQQDFWNSWTKEYLSELQQRPKKWRTEQPNLQTGDIVLIKDIKLPPRNWPLARITAIHPGEDGIVRAVSIKHKNGETKRAISKLCRLPVTESHL